MASGWLCRGLLRAHRTRASRTGVTEANRFNSANSPSPHRPAPARSASAQPAASVLLACCKRDVSVMLRRGFDGVTMGLRRDSVFFPSLPPISALLPAHPPCQPPFLPSAFLLVPL